MAAGGVAGVLAVPALAATKTVKIGDNYYGRKGTSPTVTIHKGDKVKWVWVGKKDHNVYQIGGPGHFHSPTHKGSGATFTHKFKVKGTYKFQCTYHADQHMKVKVT
jgi:plastocyanin